MMLRMLNSFFKKKIGVLNYFGEKIYFPPGSLVADQILKNLVWEPLVERFLIGNCRSGTWMFDVGANIGVSAVSCLKNVEDLRVASFEASPRLIGYLNKTKESNSRNDQWEIVPRAVADFSGQNVEFYEGSPQGGDAFGGLTNTGRFQNGLVKVSVPTTSLDEYWKALDCPPVSVVKIDVEGGELGVLKGSGDLLKVSKPVIITEWCRHNFLSYGNNGSDLFYFATNNGYRLFLIELPFEVTCPVTCEIALNYGENFILIPQNTSKKVSA